MLRTLITDYCSRVRADQANPLVYVNIQLGSYDSFESRMHRSASSSNAGLSDEFFVNLSQAAMASPLLKAAAASDDLPKYDDYITETTKKETAFHHHKSTGEKAVHLIPVVLILCALTLWLLSRPAGKI
ncbi:hypothetical protein SCA6_011589 [Theobroma cacao]|uniref:Uncharacterized protein LOC18588704 n=2 Tax=Theobroma cacao TaxID=3641 RepID=A0AB32WZ56_THECC|nr:PREDICTED: uncharacterized protein LOC18588704 [Theobroma cacao]